MEGGVQSYSVFVYCIILRIDNYIDKTFAPHVIIGLLYSTKYA